jgi:glycine cleavage system transcriptional repressor
VSANYAVSAIGRDRPGIVAALSGVLLELGGNIDDSQMSILHGHFAVMLIVSLPEEGDRDELENRLDKVREELGLESVAIGEVDALAPRAEPSHVISVYGADHPGIVHAVSSALADRGANITDLKTRVAGGEAKPVYVMVIEAALGENASAVEAALEQVGREAAVEVSVRRLDSEAF